MNNFIQLSGLWGFLATIIGLILILITVILIVLIITGRVKEFSLFSGRFGKKGISFKSKSNNIEDFCGNNKCNGIKINNILLKVIGIQDEIKRKFDSIFFEQVNYLEQRIEYLREEDLKIFLDFLLEKFSTKSEAEIEKGDFYQAYINIVFRVYKGVFDIFKVFLKENHIEDHKGSKWNMYKKKKIDILFSKMNKEFDISFLPTLIPLTKSEINMRIQRYLRDKIIIEFNDIFEYCRNISVEKHNDIKNLNQEYENFINGISDTEIKLNI